jgi:hypothetical protein
MPRDESDAPGQPGRGLALAHEYFGDVVGPLLSRRCPELPYAAGRVGTGSEVLGLDDAMSQDHDWGLRLELFVPPDDVSRVTRLLEERLPDTFQGHPSRLAFSGEPGRRLGVEVTTVPRFARDRLGFDPSVAATTSDWLSVSGQAALEVVSGAVFADHTGELTRLRQALAWYPDDIWRYVVASDWRRLDQELPLMGRAGSRGDELGSRTIAARLVDIAVHLAFTLSRTWQPYSKWRGTMFARLPIARTIEQPLHAALAAGSWTVRAEALRNALDRLAEHQVDAGLPSCTPAVVPFWDRPYHQVDPSLVPALMSSVEDPGVRALPVGLGGIEQRTDNVDILVHAERRRATTVT